MTFDMLAARIAIGAAVLAIAALVALHVLRPDVPPTSTMISQYALGRFGWVMALCFASFSVAGASLCIALFGRAPSAHGLVGLAFLSLAAVGGAMAALFP